MLYNLRTVLQLGSNISMFPNAIPIHYACTNRTDGFMQPCSPIAADIAGLRCSVVYHDLANSPLILFLIRLRK